LDLVLTVVFYICAVLAVVGGLAAALAPVASWRLVGLLAVAVGAAGVLVSLSAGFAALVALVCLGGSTLLLGGLDLRSSRPEAAAGRGVGGRRIAGGATASLPSAHLPSGLSAQLGGIAAALLLVVFLVVAVGVGFASGASAGSVFDAAALGRALLGRDALALEAAGVGLATALAFGAAARSRRP